MGCQGVHPRLQTVNLPLLEVDVIRYLLDLAIAFRNHCLSVRHLFPDECQVGKHRIATRRIFGQLLIDYRYFTLKLGLFLLLCLCILGIDTRCST